MFKSSLHISIFFFLALNCTIVFSQQRIFYTVSGGDLYAMDPLNCTNDFIGSTGIGFGDIAFTSDGRLWGINDGKLYNIDTINASLNITQYINYNTVSLVGLNDSILLSEAFGNLYKLNVNNGILSLIGNIGYIADGDLVMFDDVIYMLTPFIKIVTNENFTNILEVVVINDSLPSCLAGASTNEYCSPLLGFSNKGIILIDNNFGYYQKVCPNINVINNVGFTNVNGAASIPKKQSSKDKDMINVFTPNNDGINDYFQPKGKIENIKSVTIFNRWGETVSNLDYPYIWDGTTKEGVQLHEGVYYYIINQEIGCKQNEIKQNMIHLIR
jgi:gliding motility-associated-like protein